MDDIIRRELRSMPLHCQRFPGKQCDVYAVRIPDGDDVLKIAGAGELWRTRHETTVYGLLPESRKHLMTAITDEGYLLMRSAGPMNLSNRFKQPGDHGEPFRRMGRRLRQLYETSLGEVPPAVHATLTAARQRVLEIVRRDASKR